MLKLTCLILFGVTLTVALSSNHDSRITGGLVAEAKQFPWAAAIYNNGKYLCSGTLLSTKWVLTVGNCILAIIATGGGPVVVSLGGIKNIVESEPGRHDYPAGRYQLHPDFHAYEDNLGLIELDFNAELSQYIQPIGLPTRGTAVPVIGTIVGYQDTVLHFGTTLVMSRDICIENNMPAGLLTDKVFCTYFEQLANHCDPDGGAAYFQGTIQYGISVHGDCGKGPNVYVKVEPHLDWIHEVTGL